MSSNNLRVIYDNKADSSTITASSTASGQTPASNLKIDKKGSVWRSGSTTTTAILLATFSSFIPHGVILPFTNLTESATIRVIGYTSVPTLGGTTAAPTLTGGTAVFDTGTISACPWSPTQPWGAESIPSGSNTYAYGGGQYARCWIPANLWTACTSLSVTLVDPTVTYVEASRLIIGQYWTPKYNTSFGLSAPIKDLSSHVRTDAGDLVTVRGTRSSGISFDLKYMDYSDRNQFMRIIKGNGLPKPLFVSLFPDDVDYGKEQYFQVYGKLSQLDAISHPVFEIYSSQISIEEI